MRKLRTVKPEIRILGVDDGFFVPHQPGKCTIIGVVFRGGYWLEGIMRTQVEVDGLDATDKISEMIARSQHRKQLRVVMLDGITFAGFNVVDVSELSEMVGLPVIAITRERPNLEDIRTALENLPFTERRWKAIADREQLFEVIGHRKTGIFMQTAGLELNTAREIVIKTSTRSNIPEPLRVAHLIASGLTVPLNG
ncbi:DUF99 family protein [Candidatus Bathyarchaeota archaeon]|nr:DUF99 family protein [Candidatus Bathyarchaeota archaeon]